MKKVLKSRLFCFICGIVLSLSSIVFSANLNAQDILFRSRSNSFTSPKVNEALDYLFVYNNNRRGVLVGEITSFMGTVVPEHYLACDGSTYNINDYKVLADHIKDNFGSYDYFGGNGTSTFAVPDLRGEFLRGTGTNGHEKEGNGANVGVHQGASRLMRAEYYDSVMHFPGVNTSSYYNADYIERTNTYSTLQVTTGSASNQPQYSTIRPTNTSVLYIIRYD